MQHSYENLDRHGGFSRVQLLAPLAHAEFRKLWLGMAVSLVGDGVFVVALAWQAYSLSNAPSAMGTVGIAMAVPQILFLLLGGVVSDRFDRRLVMLAADGLRLAAVAAIATLALLHALELPHLVACAAAYGAGSAFFGPSFDAIVPDILPPGLLAQANSLDQFIRPLAFRLVGPALGGWLIAVAGSGAAFAVDAASFAVSAAFLLWLRTTFSAAPGSGTRLVGEIREGFSYIRAHAWLWATFLSAAFAYLAFMGPAEVLLPYVVKNDLHAGPGALGTIFAAGGVGSIACALLMGQRAMPRRPVLFIYLTWTAATLAVAAYGLATGAWQLVAACLVFNALETAGTIVWATLKQQHVPQRLLGRVSSLDWLISIGLLPISFALTGPVSGVIGVRGTLVAGGLVGAAFTFAALLVPGVRHVDAPAEDTAPVVADTPPAERLAA